MELRESLGLARREAETLRCELEEVKRSKVESTQREHHHENVPAEKSQNPGPSHGDEISVSAIGKGSETTPEAPFQAQAPSISETRENASEIDEASQSTLGKGTQAPHSNKDVEIPAQETEQRNVSDPSHLNENWYYLGSCQNILGTERYKKTRRGKRLG